MQQLTTHSLLKETPQLLNRVIGQLFDDEPIKATTHHEVTLLTPQPAKQRKLFIDQAIKKAYRVTLQVIPASKEGFAENVKGRLKKLGSQRYLLVNQDVNYILSFDQIRYIAHLN